METLNKVTQAYDAANIEYRNILNSEGMINNIHDSILNKNIEVNIIITFDIIIKGDFVFSYIETVKDENSKFKKYYMLCTDLYNFQTVIYKDDNVIDAKSTSYNLTTVEEKTKGYINHIATKLSNI